MISNQNKLLNSLLIKIVMSNNTEGLKTNSLISLTIRVNPITKRLISEVALYKQFLLRAIKKRFCNERLNISMGMMDLHTKNVFVK